AHSNGIKQRQHHHYLKGSLWCAECGSRLIYSRSTGNGGTYDYFFCVGRQRGNNCTQKYVSAEIVLSAAYRQSTTIDTGQATLDPENVWLGRMNRRRLTIEQWRDTALFVSGELREAPGGKSEDIDAPTTRCRTLYARISRLKLADTLMQFDYPDANVHAEKRAVTTTPIQKLFMMNSPFVQRMAASLAARLLGRAEDDPTRVANAYRLLFNREPDETELALALKFLRKTAASDLSRWEQYAQLLLASNELLYVD
ncbi:MAG: DUF1553 domain-containing protein, partial [Chthoniobacteraceae bacterium]